MFVTFFCGVLDLITGQLRYCNAGHNPAIRIGGNESPIVVGTSVSCLPVESNIPLGLDTGYPFKEQETFLDYDDSIFLYTDGVTEAENVTFDLFGEERLREFIRLIRERNIRKRYICYGRADFVSAHPELMKELRDIGFYYVLIGLEAADESYLERYSKRSDMGANEKAVQILNDLGINAMGMFITDLDFTAKEFRSIWKWVVKHDLKHAAISIFTPEMNTAEIKKYRGRLITHDPSHWDYLHVVAKPSKLSVKGYYYHYHVLLILLFIRAWRQGIYDFIDYKYFIGSMVKNLFRFGG
jgi:radical SAM superfamily enzyme YgiQ (UPF0313 family)